MTARPAGRSCPRFRQRSCWNDSGGRPSPGRTGARRQGARRDGSGSRSDPHRGRCRHGPRRRLRNRGPTPPVRYNRVARRTAGGQLGLGHRVQRLGDPLHDREYLVTACGRICMHRKKINISTVLAGQKLGLKEVDNGIWLISFMHYDLGYIDLEQKPCSQSTTHSARGGHQCLRNGVLPNVSGLDPDTNGEPGRDSNPRPQD